MDVRENERDARFSCLVAPFGDKKWSISLASDGQARFRTIRRIEKWACGSWFEVSSGTWHYWRLCSLFVVRGQLGMGGFLLGGTCDVGRVGGGGFELRRRGHLDLPFVLLILLGSSFSIAIPSDLFHIHFFILEWI